MRTPSIWESANRPLFVRSVWLEGSDGGGGQRHFLLDYEPARQRSHRSAKRVPGGRLNLKSPASYDFADFDSARGTHLELVGSAKARYQVLLSKNTFKPPLSLRRSLSSQRMPELRRKFEDNPSKRSSLQDIHSTISNISHSDERLAERVLNWLDLAGKTPFVRPTRQKASITPRKPEYLARRERMLLQQEKNALTCSRRPDSVKHITIIFNKEGVPVRYNRAAKLGDLNTNKRLVGNMASARLYGTSFEAAKLQRPRTTSVRKMSGDERMLPMLPSGKSFDDSSCGLSDARKQLHIFMPMPKKSLTVADDAVSVLSAAVSEQCRI